MVAHGVQNKALPAVATGIPRVVTKPGWEELRVEIRPACVPATDRNDFVRQLDRLLRATPTERRSIARRGDPDALRRSRRLARLQLFLIAANQRDRR